MDRDIARDWAGSRWEELGDPNHPGTRRLLHDIMAAPETGATQSMPEIVRLERLPARDDAEDMEVDDAA